MIDFIRNWANQIIVAVIIATIFEMILPNGNNKKYIKMIIGIYVLFTLIQPIASKITGKEIVISTNYEKYIDEENLKTYSNDFENNNSKLIKQTYIDNIKEDIGAKIEQKGYELMDCNIEITTDEENYGAIESIELKIKKQEEKVSESKIEIEKVEINVEEDVVKKSSISDKEKTELIEYLSEEYSIDKTKIIIN